MSPIVFTFWDVLHYSPIRMRCDFLSYHRNQNHSRSLSSGKGQTTETKTRVSKCCNGIIWNQNLPEQTPNIKTRHLDTSCGAPKRLFLPAPHVWANELANDNQQFIEPPNNSPILGECSPYIFLLTIIYGDWSAIVRSCAKYLVGKDRLPDTLVI
jgi:hypothetical protein